MAVTRRAVGTTEHFSGGGTSPQTSAGTANITIASGDTAVLLGVTYGVQGASTTSDIAMTVTCGGVAMTAVSGSKTLDHSATNGGGASQWFILQNPVTAIGSTGTKTITAVSTFTTTGTISAKMILIPVVVTGALGTITGGHATSADAVPTISSGTLTVGTGGYGAAIAGNGSTQPTVNTGTSIAGVTGSGFTGSDNALALDRTTNGALIANTDSGDESQLSWVTITSGGGGPVALDASSGNTGVATTTGALVVAKALAATTAGVATDTADLTVTHPGGGPVALAGQVDGAATTTGALIVAKALAARADGVATTSATLSGGTGPLVFSDNFNRADAPDPGSNWVFSQGSDALPIVSNRIYSTHSHPAAIFVPSTALSNDMWAEADLDAAESTTINGACQGPSVRLDSSGNNYYVWFNQSGGDILECWCRKDMVWTQVGSGYALPALAGRYRIEAEGSTIRVFRNNELVISGTNTSQPAGDAGIYGGIGVFGSDGGGLWASTDNFRCGDLPYPGALVGQSSGGSTATGALAVATALGGRSDGSTGGSSVIAILLEPFDDFTTNSWLNISGATIVAGRTGNCAQQTSTAILAYSIASGSQTDSWTVGFAVNVASLAASRMIVENRSVAPASIQQAVFVETDGSIRVNNAATTNYTSAAGVIPVNTWKYVEISCKLHTTAGSITVRVAGTTVLNVTGINTFAGGTDPGKYDQVRLDTNGTYTIKWDDLYVRNDLTFLGDITVPISGGVTGDLTVTHPTGGPVALAGQAAGMATDSGALVVAKSLAGQADGVSTASGTRADVLEALSGSSAGLGGTTGALVKVQTLGTAGSDGTSTVSGSLVIQKALAGTSNGTSTITGDMGGGPFFFATSAGLSTCSGTMVVAKTLAGQSGGVGSSQGDIVRALALPPGRADGVALTTAALGVLLILAGRVDGVGSVAGSTLVRVRPIAGVSAGLAIVQGSTLNIYIFQGGVFVYRNGIWEQQVPGSAPISVWNGVRWETDALIWDGNRWQKLNPVS